MTITIKRIKRRLDLRELGEKIDLNHGLGFGPVEGAHTVVDIGPSQGLLMAHTRRYASIAGGSDERPRP